MASLSPLPVQRFYDSNNNPLVGGKLYTYQAGTSTPVATYTDYTGSTPNANPIILNARGEANIWLSPNQSYKFVLNDALGNLIWSVDQINNGNLSGTVSNLTTVAGTNTITSSCSAITSLQNGQVFVGEAANTNTGPTTININSYGPVNVTINGNSTAGGEIQAGQPFMLYYNGSTMQLMYGAAVTSKIQSLTASVATNALTVNYAGGYLDFRNGTAGTGTSTTLGVSALSITVPSGATLGAVNAQQARFAVVVFYNGGTPVLGIVNAYGGAQLDETNLVSPTTISAAATSASVFYSASAVSASSPYRVIGYLDNTQATAGTYVTAPSLVQGVGGLVRLPVASMVQVSVTNGNGSTNTSVRRWTNVLINEGPDITYADSATLGGSFTINTSGVYTISYTDQLSAVSNFGISLNSIAIGAVSASIPAVINVAASNTPTEVCWTAFIAAGTVLRAVSSTAQGTATTYTQFTVARVS